VAHDRVKFLLYGLNTIRPDDPAAKDPWIASWSKLSLDQPASAHRVTYWLDGLA